MDCKPTSTNRKRAGFTLTEVMVATAVALLLFAAIASSFLYSATTFLVTTNYVTLDQQTRLGLDYISRDIRQADKVLTCTSNSLALQAGTQTIRFTYDPAKRTLQRVSGGSSDILLAGCDYVRYDMFQRNATNGTYDYYPTAGTNTCKVVQVTVACSLPVYGTSRRNVSVQQSAKIVIRKK